jgi:hypothetical protein
MSTANEGIRVQTPRRKAAGQGPPACQARPFGREPPEIHTAPYPPRGVPATELSNGSAGRVGNGSREGARRRSHTRRYQF